MFWTEEDVQPMVTDLVDAFGPQGLITNEGNTLKNVCIATREYGKLWYGDITDSNETLVTKLSKIIGVYKQDIYLLAEDTFDFNTPLLKINS